MPKLSELDPATVTVVQEAPAAPASKPAPAMKLSEIKPGSYTVTEMPPVPTDDSFTERSAKAILNGIIAVGRGWDSVTGAPARSAARAVQKGDNPIEAFGKQFAEAPEKAPRGKEIAEAAGLSTDKFKVPLTRSITGGRLETSAADIGGVAADILLDPTNVLPVSTLAKGASWAARKSGQVAAKTAGKTAALVLGKEAAEGIRNKTIQALSNVPAEKVGAYAKMTAEEIAAVPTARALKDTVDSWVSKIEKSRDMAANNVKKLEADLKQSYRDKLWEFKQKTVPTTQADAMLATLENEKKVLGTLSEQADDALSRATGTVKRNDVLRLLGKTHDSLNVGKGEAVGEAAAAAQAKIKGYETRLLSQPEEIDFPTLRTIMQQVRKDIDWNTGAGEFNDALDRARKSFTESVSEVLKGRGHGMAKDPALDEYAAYMARMKPLADSLGNLNRHFGTRERALASLQSVANDKGRGKVLREYLENHAKLTGDDSMLKSLDEYGNARGVVELSQRQDLTGELFPQELERLNLAKALLEETDEKIAPLGRLKAASTQGKLNSFMNRKERSIEDEKALRLISELSGTDFIDQLEKRGVIDAFDKDATRGSKMVNLGQGAGAAVGGLVAGPAGAGVGLATGGVLGAIADKQAGPMSRGYLDAMKRPIIAVPIDAPGLNVRGIWNDRSRIDNLLKGAQILHTTSDKHEKARDAIKARIKAGENP